MLGTERKQAVYAIAIPTTCQKVHEFLGTTGFCGIWIPVFSYFARHLYEALKEQKSSLEWGPSQEAAFQTIKAKASDASALELPNVTRELSLCVHEKYKMALGVLTQKFRPSQRPVAYLSR